MADAVKEYHGTSDDIIEKLPRIKLFKEQDIPNNKMCVICIKDYQLE